VRRLAAGLLSCLCAGAALMAGPAHAQLGASLSVQSDYRYRGVSFTDSRPAASLTLNYDHASGAYVGGTAIGAVTTDEGFQMTGFQAYGGYARRLAWGGSLDLGLAHTDVVEYYRVHDRVRYSELYVGLAGRSVSAHLYYSPDYLGGRVQTLYASLDGSWTPAPAWRVFGHAGVLAPVRREPGSNLRGAQFDVRAGAARQAGPVEVQLSLVTLGPDADYPAMHAQQRTTLVLGATYPF
jgi:uncharacterized protein (TIGR02001 family)